MKKVKIVIYGSKGKMGLTLIQCVKENDNLELVGCIDSGDSLEPVANCDAVIDFSDAEATLALLEKCLELEKIIVIGTTGHSNQIRKRIIDASKRIPVIFSPNFSVGVNVLFWLTANAVKILGPDYDTEIIEMHHRLKKDAPSGTARKLAEILAESRGLDYEKDSRHGREGMPGKRTSGEIGIHSVRGGDVVGDHTVMFASQGDRLELIHRASSRESFARGALRAAIWASETKCKHPGLYDMQDVLGLH